MFPPAQAEAGRSVPRDLVSPAAWGRNKDYLSIFLSGDNRREMLIVVMP